MTYEETVEWAKAHAGQTLVWTGAQLTGMPVQDVTIVGYGSVKESGFAIVRLHHSFGWYPDVGKYAWLVPIDQDSDRYWFVRISELQPKAPTIDRGRFPHDCRVCGKPAYIGAVPSSYECSSKECVYFKA